MEPSWEGLEVVGLGNIHVEEEQILATAVEVEGCLPSLVVLRLVDRVSPTQLQGPVPTKERLEWGDSCSMPNHCRRCLLIPKMLAMHSCRYPTRVENDEMQ